MRPDRALYTVHSSSPYRLGHFLLCFSTATKSVNINKARDHIIIRVQQENGETSYMAGYCVASSSGSHRTFLKKTSCRALDVTLAMTDEQQQQNVYCGQKQQMQQKKNTTTLFEPFRPVCFLGGIHIYIMQFETATS